MEANPHEFRAWLWNYARWKAMIEGHRDSPEDKRVHLPKCEHRHGGSQHRSKPNACVPSESLQKYIHLRCHLQDHRRDLLWACLVHTQTTLCIRYSWSHPWEKPESIQCYIQTERTIWWECYIPRDYKEAREARVVSIIWSMIIPTRLNLYSEISL